MDRVPDLHARARDLGGCHVHLEARKRRAADAVATGAPADHHDQIARLRCDRIDAFSARQHAQATAEHERVGGVARMVHDRAVDGRDAHLVAVIGHAVHHAVHHALRVQRTGWQPVKIRVQRPEAQHVRVGDRARTDADHVAHHAADARVRAAERLEGAGVVVGFNLEGQVMGLVEGHDARVVHEGRMHPGLVDGLGRSADVGLEKTVHHAGSVFVGVAHQRLETLVNAVLRPGLRDHLEFRVGRVAVDAGKVIAHGSHFLEVERQAAILVEGIQASVVQAAQRNARHSGSGVAKFLPAQERCGQGFVDAGVLHDRVRKDFSGQAFQVGGVRVAVQHVPRASRRVRQIEAQQSRGADQAFRLRVGHAGAVADLDEGG